MKLFSMIAWTAVAGLFSLTAAAQRIITFDVPGGIDTTPMAVSTLGEVTGIYGDPTTGKVRGFLRGFFGGMTTFDVAGMNTIPTSINAEGQITGYYCATSTPPCNAFRRRRDGSITVTDVPDAVDMEATAIDARGQVAGNWIDSSDNHRAFIWNTDGDVTIFNIAGAFEVLPNAMNARGQTVGLWKDEILAKDRGFLRDEDGHVADLDVPGAFVTNTTPFAINSKGQIAGVYAFQCPFPNINNCSTAEHGFLREAHGNFSTFDVPNSQFTVAVGLDFGGKVVGYYEDSSFLIRGFVRTKNGSMFPFAVPNALFTVPAAMSPTGVVTGTYADSTGKEHGFIAIL